MITVKTSELTGIALDWAVAKAEMGEWVKKDEVNSYRPTSDWWLAVGLIEKYDISLSRDGYVFSASASPHTAAHMQTGRTRLEAICRAVVYAKLGDKVQVPKSTQES
ncbi:DUF2591 domain-containing protein [Providencia vermicola]|uniref:phage protein NinX family protein n=1 Tax=Providencia vermicola TaxID=333965 RepID=UPI0013A71A02|nr:phage protein NinX family protein [Providencia vermicola]QIC15373.1 DUF2591 domain-containing protein [Providencia vermicola]